MRLDLRESIQTGRSADEVFAYVSDFRRHGDWRTEVYSSTQSPPGPMAEGSRLVEEARIMGRRVVTESVVNEFEAGRRFAFRHISGPIPVSGEYLVEPVTGGAVLTYGLQAELRGPWALAAPYLRRAGPRMMAASLRNLQTRLHE